jgi:zinc/manganese transport system ATP-binding protein
MGMGLGGCKMILTLSNLTLTYQKHPAVHHLSGTVNTGEMLAIIGPNGAGKSTLLRALANLHPVAGGKIQWAKHIHACDVAYLPQRPKIEMQFPITVYDFVLAGFWHDCGGFGHINHTHQTAADQALSAVDLSGFASRQINTLSAGQMQRLLFARMIVQDAQVLLLDEPFNAVDARTTQLLLALLKQFHAKGKTIIAVLHDIEQIRTHFTSCLLLARDAIAWGETKTTLTDDNLLHARNLAEAWDDHAMMCNVA